MGVCSEGWGVGEGAGAVARRSRAHCGLLRLIVAYCGLLQATAMMESMSPEMLASMFNMRDPSRKWTPEMVGV